MILSWHNSCRIKSYGQMPLRHLMFTPIFRNWYRIKIFLANSFSLQINDAHFCYAGFNAMVLQIFFCLSSWYSMNKSFQLTYEYYSRKFLGLFKKFPCYSTNVSSPCIKDRFTVSKYCYP